MFEGLQPAFRHATGHESTDSDVLSLPVICLVVCRDGEITGVYPACDGDRHLRVEDALDWIESGVDLSNLSSRARTWEGSLGSKQ